MSYHRTVPSNQQASIPQGRQALPSQHAFLARMAAQQEAARRQAQARLHQAQSPSLSGLSGILAVM